MNSNSVAPTIMVNVAFLAPTSPPETGASTYPTFLKANLLANSRVAMGDIELMSMTVFPSDSAL